MRITLSTYMTLPVDAQQGFFDALSMQRKAKLTDRIEAASRRIDAAIAKYGMGDVRTLEEMNLILDEVVYEDDLDS